jgi:hypothetical protein
MIHKPLGAKPMRFTLRIWRDGELVRHRCGDDAGPPAVTILSRTMHNTAWEGCEVRLYNGSWRAHENIDIEHLIGDEMVRGTVDERMVRLGLTKDDIIYRRAA